MEIVRCTLTLLEKTFFSSREISNVYYTEPLIGNYALAYALGFCRSPYANDGTIYYHQHLGELNARELYVTPATLDNEPKFFVEQFNSQPETYWSAMGAGVLVTRPDGARMEQNGKVWYVRRGDGRRKKVGSANRPQFGRIRYLAVGNVATFYVLTQDPVTIARYIRLGKFMSKARVDAEVISHERIQAEEIHIPFLLNPADLTGGTHLKAYDLVTVPPTPLVRNAVLHGTFYRLDDGTMLPADMCFGLKER